MTSTWFWNYYFGLFPVGTLLFCLIIQAGVKKDPSGKPAYLRHARRARIWSGLMAVLAVAAGIDQMAWLGTIPWFWMMMAGSTALIGYVYHWHHRVLQKTP